MFSSPPSILTTGLSKPAKPPPPVAARPRARRLSCCCASERWSALPRRTSSSARPCCAVCTFRSCLTASTLPPGARMPSLGLQSSGCALQSLLPPCHGLAAPPLPIRRGRYAPVGSAGRRPASARGAHAAALTAHPRRPRTSAASARRPRTPRCRTIRGQRTRCRSTARRHARHRLAAAARPPIVPRGGLAQASQREQRQRC